MAATPAANIVLVIANGGAVAVGGSQGNIHLASGASFGGSASDVGKMIALRFNAFGDGVWQQEWRAAP